MSRRWIQNLCILVLFLVSFVAVIAVGVMQGERNATEITGTELEEKDPWDAPSGQDRSEPQIVYVTPSGSKYHYYADCSSLKRSTKITGTPYSQQMESTRDLCSYCEKRKATE